MKNGKILCPSSVCIEGSALIGIVNSEGTVDMLKKTIPVTSEFLEEVNKGSKPAEQRFRFTNSCVQNACKQWNGKGCGIIDTVTEFIAIEERVLKLPDCGIRKYCRWYLQKGSDACKVCPLVITNNTDHM